jgi:hypothetical protein
MSFEEDLVAAAVPVAAALVLQSTERADYKPYATSALSGYAWLQEHITKKDKIRALPARPKGCARNPWNV